MPVNIHRANVLWYNKTVFADNGIEAPATFEDFFAACETLQAAGITPFAMGTKEGFEAGHVFETVLLGTLGADGYRGLWTGETDWTDPEVAEALENFTQMMDLRQRGSRRADLERGGRPARRRQGRHDDHGRLDRRPVRRQELHRLRLGRQRPAADGVFDALSDTFALPKDAPHRENASPG